MNAPRDLVAGENVHAASRPIGQNCRDVCTRKRRHEPSALAMATIQAVFRDLFLRAVSWSFARRTSDLFDEESFSIHNSKWSAPLVYLWIIIYPLFLHLG